MAENCNHFFVLGDKKTTASCTGTHYTYCKHCGIDVHTYTCQLVMKIGKLDMSAKEFDKMSHVHVWDPIKKDSKEYQCVASVTDWDKSTDRSQIRVQCSERIILSNKSL